MTPRQRCLSAPLIFSLSPRTGGLTGRGNTCNLCAMTWIRADLPADLHKWLKLQAVEKGVSLRELIVQLLQEAKEKKSR